MASLVIIDETVKEKIKSIIEHAEKHITTYAQLKRISEGEANPVGDSDEFTVLIPQAIKAVFSYEEQGKPIGMVKHLSVSVNIAGRVPHPAAVIMIMKEFGFKNDFEDCIIFEEKFGGNSLTAINVIEPKNGEWDKDFLIRLKNLKKKEKAREKENS